MDEERWVLSHRSKQAFVEWAEDDSVNLSVVFSWHVEKAKIRAEELKKMGFNVKLGGPAIGSNKMSGEPVTLHNPNATFTSRGCIRKCPFCVVPKIEGELRELKTWIPRPIVCDNNLLACSRIHFDKVIDSLRSLHDVDFNQGLDARLLRLYHASRITELKMKWVRIAWDCIDTEKYFTDAFNLLVRARVPKHKIGVYVLIGFNDTPEDALYRVRRVERLGGLPFPMRYQPTDATKKNSFVGKHWTHHELVRFMRYWSNRRITKPIPYEEFVYG